MSFPSHARVVVIGGGIAGCSAAYHLAESGWSDVVLVERNSLSSGTTWHAAGDVVPVRASAELVRLVRYSVELYQTLSKETGQDIGWKHCGVLNAITSQGRLVDMTRQAAFFRSMGGEASIISSTEAAALNPFIRTDDLLAGLHTREAYRVNPADVVQALAKAGRARGVKIIENARVTSFETREFGRVPRIGAVITDQGRIECEAVVLACGAWTRDLGRKLGIAVPLHAVEHSYLITNRINGVTDRVPITRDADANIYSREEVGGFLIGFFEPSAKPLSRARLPDDFSFASLPEDWEHLGPYLERAVHRYPPLESAGIKLLFTGPESFTPDGHFLIGPAPGLAGVWVLAGFNSSGIALSGGAGRALAGWITNDDPGFDTSHFDLRRLPRAMGATSWIAERATEMPSWQFGVNWPRREHRSARNLRLSPLHSRLETFGARFGQAAGWERANWFQPQGRAIDDVPTFGRPGWLEPSATEHRAARESVAIYDRTPMGKLLVQGPDAEALLQRLCAGDIGVAAGRVVYTPMLNERGGIESDLTVTRLAEDRFLVVTGAAETVGDLDRMVRAADGFDRVVVTDVTGGYAALSINGPRARDLLVRLVEDDLSSAAFPYMTARELWIGPAAAWALRLSYAGELGFELYIPSENAVAVHDALWAAGADLGLCPMGAYAADSLRLEKAYRAFGRDISPRETPFEAGLGFAVRLDKRADFVGRGALLRQRDSGPRQRLAVFTTADPEAFPVGREPIWRDGHVVGNLTSAAFGHTVGQVVALGYVRNDAGSVDDAYVLGGTYEIEIGARRFGAAAGLAAPYDPRGARLRL